MSTFAIAEALDNKPIRIIGCVMTCLLITAWATIFSMMIRAVVRLALNTHYTVVQSLTGRQIVKDILWPQKQEDRAEGGWKMDPNEKGAPVDEMTGHGSQSTGARAALPDPAGDAAAASFRGERHEDDIV